MKGLTAAGLAALILGALSLGSAVALFITAIWTHGPDSFRYGGSGAVAMLVGIILVTVGAIGITE